ncbi:DUF4404 family protein [Streptomyces subrutilus]|uniref:DUF4404 family protein n=1 Tax=Streptomyces subrutilus TaxID=36818 RepID=A0A5P2UCI4_9ACTN|nr:DUF4404 family protein [Streptomyces subrutilus]QEU76983.1 DUF4404 family protein [Streptomyces subrutilus]WSJ27872.1 DUF4404 family protein [Streptomyces subrutilus]GHA00316.1 hypothetical protein GCM10010371_69400 [Streptomyces subrutilus]
MSDRTTHEHLEALREELRTSGSRLSPQDRAHLEALLEDAAADDAAADPGVTQSLNHAAERFEVDHPSLSAALRNIGVSLANIGI